MTDFVTVEYEDIRLEIEYQWLNKEYKNAPIVIFLHEGLGSVSLWKDFPKRLCDQMQCQGIVYSRPGYGQSSSPIPKSLWGFHFLHRHAQEILPSLLEALNINHPIWLLGHSDGASIALIYAALNPGKVQGLIVMAPHIFVEDISTEQIQKAKIAYQTTDLRDKLSRHHKNSDVAFYGWNDTWLEPQFKFWSIEDEINSILCPLLALQGKQDQYGTLKQIEDIKLHAPHAELQAIPNCRHTPHQNQPTITLDHISTFMIKHLHKKNPANLQ